MYREDQEWWKKFHEAQKRQAVRITVSHAPEVDIPTYRVVGPIERVDQRDTMQSRMVLKPETPEYEDYYQRHPEHKEWDDTNRKILKKAVEKHRKSDPLGVHFQPTVFSTRHILGTPEMVRGESELTPLWENPGGDATGLSSEELTKRIKSYALYLGATKVRVTRLRKEWVYTHYAHPYAPEPYGTPVDLDYEYIICLAFRQNRYAIGAGDNYIATLEVGWRYSLISLITITLASAIRAWGFEARSLPPENSPYMVVPTFIDAGMGEQGRMGHCFTKEFGNNFRPGALATNMPLEIDKPVDFGLQDFCDKCRVCVDACPSGAIPDERTEQRGIHRWQMDPKKCRGYWNHMGHSCAICQIACPWNFESTWFHDMTRNLNQNFSWFRRPAVWGYKLFYEKSQWNPDPKWVKTHGHED